MTNSHSIDSLRELNAKLLADIVKLRKANAKISDLKRKLVEFESKKVELKARLAEALRQAIKESKKCDAENAELKTRIKELEKNKADSLAENVRRDDAIAELKAEVVKLRDDNEGSNQVTFLLPCMSDQKSSEDRQMDIFLDDAHKKSVSSGIRQRNKEKKLLCESKSSDSTETIHPSTSLMMLEESISGEWGYVVIIPDNSSEVFKFSDSKTVKKLQDQ